MMILNTISTTLLLSMLALPLAAQNVTLYPVDSAWAKNSINAVVFRKNSLTSWKDVQYIAYYDPKGFVVIGRRNLNEATWTMHTTRFKGNAQDAHNSISIMVDGDGYLHLSWDHHNTPLKYARSITPGSFEFATMPMTGLEEDKVAYPEFFRLPNGTLIFLYRSGQSGEGKLIMNQYNLKDQRWMVVHKNLIDGEGQRNAYWQSAVDKNGTIHLSWVWRETPDVSSNHDLCYAKSIDAGRTWITSTGRRYALPITASTAEYVRRIPQGSELINQTSMYADENGTPYIATYWKEKPDQVPQYHILYKEDKAWKSISLDFRNTSFSLSGQGTKSIPISRPQIMVNGKGENTCVYMLFRDAERQNKASLLTKRIHEKDFSIVDLTETDLGSWEPTYDTDLWKSSGILSLFIQRVHQVDGEGLTTTAAELVEVLEWIPEK